MHNFILTGKQLPVHWLTTMTYFVTFSVMFICGRGISYVFVRGRMVTETPIALLLLPAGFLRVEVAHGF